jgi:4-hydroxybenzoate polyprenyltransferase
MEILWICMAAMCFIIAIIRNVRYGFDEGKAMYIFSVLAVLMYLWRRHLRKKEEERDDTKKQ